MPFNHGNINSFCSPISTLAFRTIFKRPVLTSVLLPEKKSAAGNRGKLGGSRLLDLPSGSWAVGFTFFRADGLFMWVLGPLLLLVLISHGVVSSSPPGLGKFVSEPLSFVSTFPLFGRVWSDIHWAAEGQETLDCTCCRTESLTFHFRWQNPKFKAHQSLLFNPGGSWNLIFSVKAFQAPTFPSLGSLRTGPALAGLCSSDPAWTPGSFWQSLCLLSFCCHSRSCEDLWGLRGRRLARNRSHGSVCTFLSSAILIPDRAVSPALALLLLIPRWIRLLQTPPDRRNPPGCSFSSPKHCQTQTQKKTKPKKTQKKPNLPNLPKTPKTARGMKPKRRGLNRPCPGVSNILPAIIPFLGAWKEANWPFRFSWMPPRFPLELGDTRMSPTAPAERGWGTQGGHCPAQGKEPSITRR